MKRKAREAKEGGRERGPRVFPRRGGLTNPLVEVDDLFRWRPTGMAAKCVSSVALSEAAVKRYVRGGQEGGASVNVSALRGASGSLKRLQPPRLLLCHDFKDGYQEWEADASGAVGDSCPKDRDMWRFNHWAYVDIFVYFSHYCVTIPPVGYIHAAHRHGALCLGTLIFEWEAGALQLQKILASFKTRAKAASQLASIAKFYGFDGWLVNVEVALQGGSTSASDLVAFVGDLTRATKKVVGQVSEVIWYDSVIRDGSLSWQNELNMDNEPFFKAAGNIFTNYHWDRSAPVRSAVKAGTRRTDVFTGIDIHGRNTFGGGGFHTHIAMRAIKQGGTSAALFAPAWTVEKCPPGVKDPRELEERFWTGPKGRFGRESVAQYFKERPVLTDLPFQTNFDPGWGPRTVRNGVVKDDRRYFNMAQQQIQPSFMRSFSAGGDSAAAHLSLSHERVYNGSAAMKTCFEFSESRMLTGSFSILRLFVASVVFQTRLSSRLMKTQEGSLEISYDYFGMGEGEGGAHAAADDFGMVLMFASPPCAVFLVGHNSKWAAVKNSPRRISRLQVLGKFVNIETVVATSDEPALGAPDPEEGSTGWMTRTFLIEANITSGQRLAEMMIIVGGPPQQPVSVRASPFMTPTASRGASRLASRNPSRYGSRYGSRAGSRSNSPPREQRMTDSRDEDGPRYRPRGDGRIPSDLRPPSGPGQEGDDFGSDLLNQFRESFNQRRSNGYPPRGRNGSDVGRGPLTSALGRRQDAVPGVFPRRLDEFGDEVADDRRDGRSYRGYPSTYASNFQVEGSIDFGQLEMDDGLASVGTSRALSRLSSRLQTPSVSRPVSRYGSRYGSRVGSVQGSLAGSLAASRTGSLANSRNVSRHASRFTSPTRTPGGRGVVQDGGVVLGQHGVAGMTDGGSTTPKGGAALKDLRSALMQAAENMVGDGEGAEQTREDGKLGGGGGAASGKQRIVYLGGVRMEGIGDEPAAL